MIEELEVDVEAPPEPAVGEKRTVTLEVSFDAVLVPLAVVLAEEKRERRRQRRRQGAAA